MNPKMTEFLAQDRVAGFRNEAAGHHIQERAAMAGPTAPPDVPATKHATTFVLIWHRVRRVIAV